MARSVQAGVVAVVGLGKTGQSCIRYLLANGHRVIACDTRSSLPQFDAIKQPWPSVEFRLGSLDEKWLSQADEIVVSPGVSLQHEVLDRLARRGISIIGDTVLFRRAVTKPIVAITGSNAKSTVTSLVGHLLRASGMRVAVGGNLGTPMLDLLDNRAQAYVLELSSFQLEAMTHLNATVAMMLNLSEDHLDRHGTMENYRMIKQRIYQGCEVAVFSRDDLLTKPVDLSVSNLVSFGLSEPQHASEWGIRIQDSVAWLCKGNQAIVSVDRLQIKGRHNASNVLAALAAVDAMGVDIRRDSAAVESIHSFAALPHRCEWVATIDEVAYIDDSKGTNVGATVAAINGFSVENRRNVIVILGGQGKGADFSKLLDSMVRSVKCAMLIGEDAHLIEQALHGHVAIKRCESLAEAVNAARACAASGDTVLLSPACASFDMFRDYSHRGDVFRQCVLQFREE